MQLPEFRACAAGTGSFRPSRVGEQASHLALGDLGRILVDLTGTRLAPVAADVLLAHIRDRRFGVRRLDLERGDERVLGGRPSSDPFCP